MPLPQHETPEVLLGQTETHGSDQQHHCREAHLQLCCANGTNHTVPGNGVSAGRVPAMNGSCWSEADAFTHDAVCSLWREGGVHAAEGPCWESWVWSGSNLLAWGCCLQVQSAALDEMFHHREDCAQRYHKALLLMEGLLNIITEQGDIENINKCECSVTSFSSR